MTEISITCCNKEMNYFSMYGAYVCGVCGNTLTKGFVEQVIVAWHCRVIQLPRIKNPVTIVVK